MKLAVPAESKSINVPVCSFLGRTPLYAIIDTESGDCEFLDNSAAASQGGAGIKTGQMLADQGVKAVITYRCGKNAAEVLNAANIILYQAQEGSVSENIAKFQRGELSLLSDIHPGFHNHGGGRE